MRQIVRFARARGVPRVLVGVAFRKENPVRQYVEIRWAKGIPKRQDESWFLMSDLCPSADALAPLKGKRSTIEELFPDLKGKCNGWFLPLTLVRHAIRLDPLLHIEAIAYCLLLALGCHALAHCETKHWCSTNASRKNRKECSAFTIQRFFLVEATLLPQSYCIYLVRE